VRSKLAPVLALLTLSSARLAGAEEPIEVTVRGQRDTASKRDPTLASSVVEGEALQRPGATASDALERVPGVRVERTGASSDLATASVRGATSAQFPVYLAGIRLNDDVAGTADLSQVPLWMIERVEVFRGGAPAQADRLGIAGAAMFEPRLPKHTRSGGEVGVGSFGWLSTGLGYEVAQDGSGALVSLVRQRADDDYEYTDDRGTRAVTADDRVVRRINADHTTYDAWAIGRTRIGERARITTVLNAFEREQGVTGFLVIPARAARARVRRELAGIDATLPCFDGGDACAFELSVSGVRAHAHVNDPLSEIGLSGAWLSTRAVRANFAERVRIFPDERSEISVSFAQEAESLDLVSPAFSLPATRELLGATLFASRALSSAFSLYALGRVDCQRTVGPSRDADACSELDPSGRLAARVELGENLVLLSNAGRYVRTPTLGELYGQSPLVQGNAALRPERGLAVDAGVRGSALDTAAVKLGFELFAFAREARDLVSYQRSSFGFLTPYNVGRSRTLGFELGAQAELWNALSASLTATGLDPVDTTPGRTLANDLVPFQSRLLGRFELELFSKQPWSLEWLERASIGASVAHRSSSVADPAGVIVIPSSDLVEAFSKLALFEDRLALRMSIHNVFDAVRFDRVGFPVPGRAASAAAELWW
jgi:vitamin B12 transporter